MDENLERAIHDTALATERLGAALYEEVCEAAEHLAAVFSRAFEDLEAALAAVASAYDEIKALAYDRSEARQKERKKWARVSSVPLKPLFLDRRKAVHHCRNTC